MKRLVALLLLLIMVIEPFAVYAEGEGVPAAVDSAAEEVVTEEPSPDGSDMPGNDPMITEDLSQDPSAVPEEDLTGKEDPEEVPDDYDQDQAESSDEETESVDQESVEAEDDQIVDKESSTADSKKRAAAAKAADDLGFEFDEDKTVSPIEDGVPDVPEEPKTKKW